MDEMKPFFSRYRAETIEDHLFVDIYCLLGERDIRSHAEINGIWGKWWEVIYRDDNRALLLSAFPVAFRKFDTYGHTRLWKDCTLRKWLNGAFYDSLACGEYVSTVELQTVKEPQKSAYKNDYGLTYTTEDSVFLLSAKEVKQYMTSNQARQWPFPYVGPRFMGYRVSGWGLRDCCVVTPKGTVSRTETINDSSKILVRPAFWVNLSDA